MAAVVFVQGALAGVVSLDTNADTYVSEKQPDVNLGAWAVIQTRNEEGRTLGWELDGLIGFDMSAISSWTEVTSATLHLYYSWHADNDPVDRSLTAHRITEAWDEMGVTWDTRPQYDAIATDSQDVPVDLGTWMEWDVTSDVQAYVDGNLDVFGWQIMDPVPWGDWAIPIVGFNSKESGEFVPYLTVVPEPSALGLLGIGAITLVRRRRTR
jgi:hypothetical protein